METWKNGRGPLFFFRYTSSAGVSVAPILRASMGGKLTTFSSSSIPLFADVVAAEKGEGRRRPTAQQVKYGIYQSFENWVSLKLASPLSIVPFLQCRNRNIGRLANFLSFNCKASLPLCNGIQETRTSFA